MRDALGMAAEYNPYFKARLAARLKDAQPTELWNEKKVINHLLKFLRGERVKDTVKVMAIDRLNVLLGITVIDDAGNTKRAPSLDELLQNIPPFDHEFIAEVERTRAAGLRQAEAGERPRSAKGGTH